MRTILVIGGSGFLGSHLVERLLQEPGCLFATSGSRKPAAHPGVGWLACDLRDADCDRAWPARCDHVLFLAQSAAWRQFPATASEVFDVNLAGLHRAAQYAARVGARSFVFASSGSVYANLTEPGRETDVDLRATRSFYAATKMASEMLLRAYENIFAVVNLRIFMPYGRGQSAEMLMPQLIRKVREGRPIQLQGTDGLLANPVAANEVAETFARCLKIQGSATLNVAGPELLTLRAIGETIGRIVGRAPSFEVQGVGQAFQPDCQAGKPDLRGCAPVVAGDTSLLWQTLQWRPGTRLDAGLADWLLGRQQPAAA